MASGADDRHTSIERPREIPPGRDNLLQTCVCKTDFAVADDTNQALDDVVGTVVNKQCCRSSAISGHVHQYAGNRYSCQPMGVELELGEGLCREVDRAGLVTQCTVTDLGRLLDGHERAGQGSLRSG